MMARKGGVEFTNRPKCEHSLEQSYSGMYSIFQQEVAGGGEGCREAWRFQ